MEKNQEINKWLVGNPARVIKQFKGCDLILKGEHSGLYKVIE